MKGLKRFLQSLLVFSLLSIVVASPYTQLASESFLRNEIKSSSNFTNLDTLNISRIGIGYESGDTFTYSIYGYFTDANSPFASISTCIASIEYMNFSATSKEMVVNGSEYSTQSFNATIYDGAVYPNLMILPKSSYIITNFRETFNVQFEIPVLIYNTTGNPRVNTTIKMTDFANASDTVSLMDNVYDVTYNLKTNLVINSQHFNKNNVIVKINDLQVDPYNIYVSSAVFDLKLFDMNGVLVYHDPARNWSKDLFISFTSMKITNDYFDAVTASIAPVSVVDSLFYQSKISNYTDREDRPLQSGSSKYIERGNAYATQNRYIPGDAITPADAGILFEQQTNVYDENITMPYSTNINTSKTEYPFIVMLAEKHGIEIAMMWIYAPNSTDQAIMISGMNTAMITSIQTDLYFPLGIINSTLYDIQPLLNESSMENTTAIASFVPNTWHHIAVVYNQTSPSAEVFVDYVSAYNKSNIISTISYPPEDFIITAMNVTTMNATGWPISFTKNVSASVNISFNVANIFFADLSDASAWRSQGSSTISYMNSTHIEWYVSPPESGVYRAVGMRLNAKTYNDYFSWTENTVPMFGVEKFSDGYSTLSGVIGYDLNPKASIIESLDGHSRVLNLTNSGLEFAFDATDSSAVTWGDPGKEAIGASENSTMEVWITKAITTAQIIWTNRRSLQRQHIYLYMNQTSIVMNVTNASNSVVVSSTKVLVNMNQWHHVRVDVSIKAGFVGNATVKLYVDGMLYTNAAVLVDCRYDYLLMSGNMTIDAFGYRRSSWDVSPVFNSMYTVGSNMQQMWATYDSGDYTFEDAPIGSQPADVYPSFDRAAGGLDGNVTLSDAYHRNVYQMIGTEEWSYFFTIAFPDFSADFVKLPEGYGYETRGRVAFWFYVNSSYGGARFAFTVFDDAGTPYDNLDDTMHAFVIGNALDDALGQSEVVYYTKNTTDKVIKKSGYVLSNDTWNYLVFEWNSTGNRLDINEETVFHGSKIAYNDVGVTLEPAFGNMSVSGVGYLSSSGSAMRWFGAGFALPDAETDWIHDPSVRTVFTMNSIPWVQYANQYSSVGAVWNPSVGLMDSLTFEHDTANGHSYYPAMLSIPQTTSNFTTNSMLTRIYPASSWNDLSMYYGGFYNLTFDVNATSDSLPIQVTMDSSRYVTFVTQSIKHVSILHPIDVQSSDLRVSMWSANGNYTIGNMKVSLTAKTPEFVDAFKNYVDENAAFSRSIVSHGSAMTNITAGSYYLLATTYLADVAYFDKITVVTSGNDFYITEPSLRQIVIEYTDQRGIHIDYNNFQTFRLVGDGYVIIPMNVFTAEIGTSVTLLSKNIFNEVVFFGSFTVTSISNYINIITVVHSLKVYNQREDFVYGVITKDFAPQFFWSEWIAPNEVINYRLTSGSYSVTIKDETNNTVSYNFNLFGDDVLIVRSQYTLATLTNDILNVNSTIGNQITNVALNITNQNSQINNSIVNVDIRLNNINSTLGTQLLNIDAQILSVNSTINEQTAYMTSLFANVNSTIFEQSTFIESLIANINTTIDEQTVLMATYFTNINSTIVEQSIQMQNYLFNINNTINTMQVELSQTFFTDLFNNQTGNITGFVRQTVDNQTNEITLQLNNVTAFIATQTLNINNGIYNQTLALNGGNFSLSFSTITATSYEMRDLIRKTDFSQFINWSNDVEIAGIVSLEMMNGYNVPIVIEIRKQSTTYEYIIYADDYLSQYFPTGNYQYRIRQLTTGIYLPRTSTETNATVTDWKDFIISNTSRVIETSFARQSAPGTAPSLESATTNLVIFISVLVAAVIIVIWFFVSRRRKAVANEASLKIGTGRKSDANMKKNGVKGKNHPSAKSCPTPVRRTDSARSRSVGSRKGLLG